MIVQCTNCQARFRFDDAKFGDQPSKKVKCTRCATVFVVMAPGKSDSEDAVEALRLVPPKPAPLPVSSPAPARTEPAPDRPVNANLMADIFTSLSPDQDLAEPEPPAPPPVAASVPSAQRPETERPKTRAAAAEDLAFEKPAAEQAQAINKDYYDDGQKRLHLVPLIKALREVEFPDAGTEGGALGLAGPREFSKGEKAASRASKQAFAFQSRELSGMRAPGFEAPANFPKAVSIAVKLLLVAALLLVTLLGAMMWLKGDHFNYTRLSLLASAQSVLEGLSPAKGPAPAEPRGTP